MSLKRAAQQQMREEGLRIRTQPNCAPGNPNQVDSPPYVINSKDIFPSNVQYQPLFFFPIP
jgi:hypothetical protein